MISRPMLELTKHLQGKLYGDKGYISHRRQFSGFSNMRNALQSRRDYMFIALNVLNLFRSVGAICQTKTL